MEHEMVSYRCRKCFRLCDKDDPDVCAECTTVEENKSLLADSHQLANVERMGPLTTESGLGVNDFFYNPFGHGSLLEQSVWFIRDKAFHGQPNTLVNMSKMSRMLNEIIDREMRLMGIVIEDRFVFGSVNASGAGGSMWVESNGRTYMTWSI